MPTLDDTHLDTLLRQARLAPLDHVRAELSHAFQPIIDYLAILGDVPLQPYGASDTASRDATRCALRPDMPRPFDAPDALLACAPRTIGAYIATQRESFAPASSLERESRGLLASALSSGAASRGDDARVDGARPQGGAQVFAPLPAGDAAAGAVARVHACLSAIASRDGELGAFLAVDPERALAQARDTERAHVCDEYGLRGVLVGVKDNFCTGGLETTAGSRILKGFVPPYESGATHRLRRAGAIIVGKTNMDEMAMGSTGEHSAVGPTRNPWDMSRAAGGSSSGSAAAVAAGFCTVALGSDTGGSVRLPASYCGEALRDLRAAGAHCVEVTLPHLSLAIPAYQIIATAEASSNLARYDGVRFGQADDNASATVATRRGVGFGVEVLRRIVLGTFVLSEGYRDAFYLRAQRVRAMVARDFSDALLHCDVLAGPTATAPPPRLGALSRDPLAMYATDVCTVGASLAGVPALSVPCGRDELGLPVGLQLIGRRNEERRLLAWARAYEGLRGAFGLHVEAP